MQSPSQSVCLASSKSGHLLGVFSLRGLQESPTVLIDLGDRVGDVVHVLPGTEEHALMETDGLFD